MNVYNQVEQLVITTVDQVFSSIGKDSSACDSSQCRLDVACYVLNRLSPRYVVSERGFTHMEIEQSVQQQADLIALVNSGIERVSRTRRAHAGTLRDSPPESGGLHYDFPVITGRILQGLTFEAAAGISVELRLNGEHAEMQDSNWQNPLTLPLQTGGRYSFWSASIPAEKSTPHTLFDFEIQVKTSGFAEIHHFMQLHIPSTQLNAHSPKATHEVGDLYLFRE